MKSLVISGSDLQEILELVRDNDEWVISRNKCSSLSEKELYSKANIARIRLANTLSVIIERK